MGTMLITITYDKMLKLREDIRDLPSYKKLTVAQRIRTIIVLLCEITSVEARHEKEDK